MYYLCLKLVMYVLFMFMNLSTGRMPLDETKKGKELYGLHIRRMEGVASGSTTRGTIFGDRTTLAA